MVYGFRANPNHSQPPELFDQVHLRFCSNTTFGAGFVMTQDGSSSCWILDDASLALYGITKRQERDLRGIVMHIESITEEKGTYFKVSVNIS